MKSKLVLVALVCLLATAAAQVPGGGESPRPRAQVYALEGLGAVGGMVGGCVAFVVAVAPAGAIAMLGFALAAPYVAAAVLPAGAAVGTIKTGERLNECGSNGWAFGGTYAGALVGVGVCAIGYKVSHSNAIRIPSYVLGGLCIPTGAVLGYNLGGKREAGGHGPGLGGRLQLPGVALTSMELPDHSVEYGVKLQLAGLRF